jgi:hypothetical protein
LRVDGVRGAGLTVGAVFRRSRARLTPFPHLYYDEHEPERLLESLARLLSRHPHEKEHERT